MANPPFTLTSSSATYDTTTPKFGSAAINGGRLVSAAPVMVAGMTAFTIECWFKTTNSDQNAQVIAGQNGAAFIAKFGDHIFAEWGSGNSQNIDWESPIVDNAWHHAAFNCGPNGATLYIDGDLKSSSAVSYAASEPIYTNLFGIMDLGEPTATPFLGEADEVRVSSLIRYTGDFTPSTTAFVGTLANTRALWPVDSSGADISTTGTDMTPSVPTTTLPVTSPAMLFSPGNWRGDTGRGGTVSRSSWNNGAWIRIAWNASANPVANLLVTSTARTNMLSYFINDVLVDNVSAAANVAISNIIPSARNTMIIFLRNSAQVDRWSATAVNQVTVAGFQIDTSSSADIAAVLRPWGLVVGDSITEGIEANNGSDDFLADYSFLTLEAMDQLGYDVGLSACGYSGWLVPGDSSGDVLAYYDTPGGTYNDSLSRWNKISAGISLLDANSHISAYGATSTEPAFIYINYATNDALQTKTVADMQASITQSITALRLAAPNAKILIQIPFGLQNLAKYPTTTYVAAIKAAVATHSSDANVFLLDFGVSLANKIQGVGFINGDGVHPLQTGHALVAPMVSQKIAQAFGGSGTLPNRWTHG